jgi:hypothetical protein
VLPPLKVLFALVAAVGLGVVIVLGIIIAPEIDERVGFFTGRAMKTIQSYEIDGLPLQRVIDREFKDVRWRAYHQDIFMQTFVECTGSPRSGGSEQIMLWYVDERPAWDHGLSLKVTVMTVLNGNALKLTPQLFDPSAGHRLDRWRHGVELP